MDPFTWIAIISALLSGVGAYQQNRAVNRQAEAMAQAERAERFRQAELQRQADEKLRAGIQQFTPTQQQNEVQQAAATREAAYQPPPAAPADTYQAAAVSAPTEVKTDLDRRLGDVTARAREGATRRARLEAFGDAATTNQFQIGRLGEELRRLGDSSASSQRLFGIGLNGARGAGRHNAQAADIYNTLGQLGMAYAFTRRPQRPADASVIALPTSEWPSHI